MISCEKYKKSELKEIEWCHQGLGYERKREMLVRKYKFSVMNKFWGSNTENNNYS